MPSSIINKTSRQKINKDIKELNNIINKLDLRRFTEHSTQPQTKKQENMTHTQEKNQPIEAVPEMTEVMELAKNLKYLL